MKIIFLITALYGLNKGNVIYWLSLEVSNHFNHLDMKIGRLDTVLAANLEMTLLIRKAKTVQSPSLQSIQLMALYNISFIFQLKNYTQNTLGLRVED